MTISKELLEILACPACKSSVKLVSEKLVEERWVPVRVENAVMFAVEFEYCHLERSRSRPKHGSETL